MSFPNSAGVWTYPPKSNPGYSYEAHDIPDCRVVGYVAHAMLRLLLSFLLNLQSRAHERHSCEIRFRAGIGTYLVDGDRFRQGPAEFGFVA
jgi:hypothetical protein